MKTVQNLSASLFILAVAILSVISIMGVWEFFDKDVISKSFQTLGLLALVAIIVIAAGKFIENRSNNTITVSPDLPSPIWKSVRVATLTVLIGAVSLLAFLGVLAIWEVIQDQDVIHKSLSSLAIFAFGTFIIVVTCLDREGKVDKKNLSAGSVAGLLILAWILFSFWY